MNSGITSLGDRAGASGGDLRVNRVSAFSAALSAYRFLFRHFGSILGLVLLPVTAAGMVLYLTLSRYLAELLVFLEEPNPRVASLALGTLAAGLFLSLFCYAMAVSSVCDFALGKHRGRGWPRFRTARQDWRLYAAYLRLLLLLSTLFAVVFLFSTYVTPQVLSPYPFSSWVLTLVSVVGMMWIFACVGFPIAPVVAVSEGPILRRARQESARDLWRNCLLIVLLLVPGIFVLIGGGYAFQMGALRVAGTLPLADSVRAMNELLGSFVTIISLAMFVSIALLTVGALAAYQTKRLKVDKLKPNKSGPNLHRSLPAEGPPE